MGTKQELKPLTLKAVRAGLKKLADRRAVLREQVKRLDIAEQRLMARCPHDMVYHGDPSGNNDSYHECAICGSLG